MDNKWLNGGSASREGPVVARVIQGHPHLHFPGWTPFRFISGPPAFKKSLHPPPKCTCHMDPMGTTPRAQYWPATVDPIVTSLRTWGGGHVIPGGGGGS